MEDIKKEVKKITAKDEKLAVEVITNMINNSDTELFKELISHSEYLFPFIKENVCKRFEMSIKGSNYQNIFNFLDYYSPDYDKVFVTAIKVFGQDTIKSRMLDLIKNGSTAQKTYAARYYEIAPDLFAIKELVENAFCDDEYLADACAAALGAMNEQKSYQIGLEKLQSDDDFDSLKALNFFVSYGKNTPFEEIFAALNKSGMPENFAGKIGYIIALPELIQKDLKNSLIVIDAILSGFGEILPLSEVFNYELYNVLNILFELKENDFSSQIASIMLKALNKIQMICTNDEYTFDEDKNTKDELKEINEFLQSLDKKYWDIQKQKITEELTKDRTRILSALNVIRELNIISAIPNIVEMVYETEDETIICEGLSILKEFDAISYVNKEDIFPMLTNETLKAVVESYY